MQALEGFPATGPAQKTLVARKLADGGLETLIQVSLFGLGDRADGVPLVLGGLQAGARLGLSLIHI